MKVEDFKKIEIIPNENGGIQLFVNGEKIDLKDTMDVHLDLCINEEHNLVFELTARKRLMFLTDYSQDLKG